MFSAVIKSLNPHIAEAKTPQVIWWLLVFMMDSNNEGVLDFHKPFGSKPSPAVIKWAYTLLYASFTSANAASDASVCAIFMVTYVCVPWTHQMY